MSGSLASCEGMSEGYLGHSPLDQNGNSCDLTPYGNCLMFCLSEWNSIDSDKNQGHWNDGVGDLHLIGFDGMSAIHVTSRLLVSFDQSSERTCKRAIDNFSKLKKRDP